MRLYVVSLLLLLFWATAYIGARAGLRALDPEAFRGPHEAGSLDDAVRRGTLVGTYAGTCAGTPYAERLVVHRLDVLLRRRVAYTDRIAIHAPPDADSLVLGDGTRAACCRAVRRAAPDSLWLVRDGARVCAFGIVPDSRSAGLPNRARVTEP